MSSKPLTYEKIGSGTYGNVYRIDSNTVRKDCSIVSEDLCNIETTTIREIVFLSTYSHPHIRGVNLIEFMDLKVSMYMPEGGVPLNEWVKNTTLTQRLVIIPRIVAQICSVLSYLESMDMSHGDLKPSNILINSDNDIKIIDWGACCYLPHRQTVNGCTEQFSAPELLDTPVRNGPPADIFSLGMIVRFLIYGTFETMRWIKWCCHSKGKVDILNSWEHGPGLDFVRKCQPFLSADYKSRPTAAEICDWKELESYKTKNSPSYKHSNGRLDTVVWTDSNLFSPDRRIKVVKLICMLATKFNCTESIMPSVQLFEEYAVSDGYRTMSESNINIYAGACLMIVSCLLNCSLHLVDFLKLINPNISCIKFYTILLDILEHFSCEVYRLAFTDKLERISVKHLQSLLLTPDIMNTNHEQRMELYTKLIADETKSLLA